MKKRIAILAGFAAVLLGISAVPVIRAATQTPQDRTDRVLRQLELRDAAYVGEETFSLDQEERYHCYRLGEDGACAYFCMETGRLMQLEDLGALEREQSEAGALSPEAHRDYAREWAEKAVDGALLGELVLDWEATETPRKRYAFAEHYQGIPTGTNVLVTCAPSGEVYRIRPVYGTVFERNVFGGGSLRRDDSFIGEDAAVACAQEAVEQSAGAEGCTLQEEAPGVELKAHKDVLYYEVTLKARMSEPDQSRTFSIRIDAYDGEVIQVGYTK